MLTEQTLAAFAEQTASREPTPGGGSVAAYLGVLGAALGAMAARFTEGTRDAPEHPEELEHQIARLDAARRSLLELVEADARAYAGLSEAFKLPRATPDEKARRRAAVQAGLRTAMEPPLEAARSCATALGVLDELRLHVNRNLRSDVAVGAIALRAAFRSAWINVLVNLGSVDDDELRAAVRAEGESLAARVDELEASIAEDIVASLSR